MPIPLEDYVVLFNKRLFFKFHEDLESVWIRERGPDKEFYQGLIQISAAFVHYYLGRNHRGTLNLLNRGSKLLRKYPPFYGGLEIRRLLADVEQAILDIDKNDGFPKRFRFPRLREVGQISKR
ncbi:MAG: DUF309 domain-containing protein [Candidatus Bathyarchaeia archaeon]